ncbi:hypothetical protein PLESTB_000329900 [Pleodorina starrii]|uniref:FCP1 homology domain-containing protein n=1 Tax=Pleodorina starrii TaxID=330485 RepID=A0A9W6BDV6_9CHLO|nr:hypothetical protein PLESTB_000329900 [Pleodorina starrii]GLC75115.1 hypothetical protein PLESTF_001595500 [Pleodorina starrii]
MHVCAYNGQVAHRVWPRPHVRIFLETVRRLFRLAVWSSCGGSWADAALLALDPRQELLPTRCLGASESRTGTEGVPTLLDDGDAVHPADVVIVSPNRHVFGRMAPNVIEVEPYNMPYGGQHDNVLLDLANLLVRHLAVDVGTGEDGGAGTDSPATMPPPPLPPLAVPDELRRLGLDAVRVGAAHGGVAGALRRDAHPAPKTQPPTISVGIRHMFIAAPPDLLGLLPLEPEEGPGPQGRSSWQHLEFLDLVRPVTECSDREEELGEEEERQVPCNMSAAQQQQRQHQQQQPHHQQQQQQQRLASGDSLASAASCSSGHCTATDYCSSSGSFESLGDVAGALAALCSSGGSRGSSSNGSSSSTADNCCSSCAAGPAASESGRGHQGAARSGSGSGSRSGLGSRGDQAQRDAPGSNPHSKPHSALTNFLRKFRGAVPVTTPPPPPPPPQQQQQQQQQQQRQQPRDRAHPRTSADGGSAATGLPSAALKRLTGLTGLVRRSLRRRHPRHSSDANVQSHAWPSSSGSSASSASSSSSSSGESDGTPHCGSASPAAAVGTRHTHTRQPAAAAAAAAPRGGPCPTTVDYGSSTGAAVSKCADAHSWVRDRQRPTQSRVALMCAPSLTGVSRAVAIPTAACTAAATAGGPYGCELGEGRERESAEGPLLMGFPAGSPDLSPPRPAVHPLTVTLGLPPPPTAMARSETDWLSLAGPTRPVPDAQRFEVPDFDFDYDVDANWRYAPVRVLGDMEEVCGCGRA